MYKNTFSVGKYTCEATYSPFAGGLHIEWSPHVPPPKSLSKAEMKQYRDGRDALVALAASDLGVNILMVD